MKRKHPGKSLLMTLVFFLTSCVTINIYFPAAAMEKAADRIVDEVWGDESTTPEKEKDQKKVGPQSRREDSLWFLIRTLGPGEAFAQEADINVTTPAIRALTDSIQARADSIKPLMDSGNVGIANDGLLAIRSTEGLNLKDKARLTRLIEAENNDRKALYVEITRANNFSPDKVSDVQKIFAGSWTKNARDGWWVQDADGTWQRK